MENFNDLIIVSNTELFWYNLLTPFSIKRCMLGIHKAPTVAPIVAENRMSRNKKSFAGSPAIILVSIVLVSNGACSVLANCEQIKRILNNTIEDANFFVRDATIRPDKFEMPMK